VLQAHLDGFFEAAVDNGTGAAAVLAAAERLAAMDTRRGLLVALYDGEEWGLLGSEALFADLASPEGLRVGTCGPEVHAEDLVAVVNLDASSAIPSDATGPLEERLGPDVPLFSWRAMVFSEEPLLASLFIEAMAANQVLGAPLSVGLANPVNGGMERTDGRWFHEAGIPVAWPVAGYPEYHTSADDIDAVDPVDLEHVTDGAVAVVLAADTAPIGRIGGSSLGSPGSIAPTPPASCRAATPTATPTAPAPAATDGGALPVTGGSGGAPLAVALLAIVVALAVRRIACED
jgi:Zn-dependent M28 family amino/carboxypeptidase